MSERVENGGAGVTPLEWGPYPNPVFAGPDIALAHVEFRSFYQAQRDPDAPGFMVYLTPQFGTRWWESKGHDTLDLAKAAAQADYERRILSALQPSSEPLNARTQGVEVGR